MVKFVFVTGRPSSKDFLDKYTPVLGILESTINGLPVELMIEGKGLLL